MKSYFKFLSKNKLYTIINILGLSISIMFVILIVNFIRRELTLDKNVKDKDRIYTIADESHIGTGFWVGERLKDKFPQIEESCVVVYDSDIAYTINDEKIFAKTLFADTTFLTMFNIEVYDCNPVTVLNSKDNVIISKSFANNVFGNVSPIGKLIKSKSREMVVAGVFSDFDNTIFPKSDIITKAINVGDYNPWTTSKEMRNAGNSHLFLKAVEGVDLKQYEKDFKDYLSTFFWFYKDNKSAVFELIPFKDIYFSKKISNVTRTGDKSLIVILFWLGVIILLFAIINYINLTTAQTGFRAKEMATRRLLGSSKYEIFFKFIYESLFMVLVAFAIGLLLAFTFEQDVNSLLQSNISVLKGFDLPFIISTVALLLIVGLLSGVIPAYINSKTMPIDIVRGTFRRKIKMVYGKVLITIQNVMTMVLIALSITVSFQISHLINAPIGYNKDGVLQMGIYEKKQTIEIVNNLKQLSFVESVALGQGSPVTGGNNITITTSDGNVSHQIFVGDENYFNMFGFKILQDNKLADNNWYFTEGAMKEIGASKEDIDITIGSGKEQLKFKVAGIVQDIVIRSILMPQRTSRMYRVKDFYNLTKNDSVNLLFNFQPWNIFIKVNNKNSSYADNYNRVNECVAKTTKSTDNKLRYVSDIYKDYYSTPILIKKIVLIFTIIAIIISSLGLLAMSIYYTQQKSMEIAVRRIFGSTIKELLVKLVFNFTKIVLIAFFISIPIIYYLSDSWLKGFSYKIAITPSIFIITGILSILMAVATIYWQCYKGATTNPVESIKIK